MTATKRIFISDVHIGMRSKKDWFREKHEPALVKFLKWVARQGNTIKDLILLGDLFELWMVPVDALPPTIEDVLKMKENREILKALRKCVAALENVFYVNGNHDMGVVGKDLDVLSTNGKTVRHVPAYQAGLLYAEHGSRFAMFNARDKLHDPKDGLPLGYFVTRIMATSKEKYDKPGSIASYIDDALEAAYTTQTLAQSVIEALMELANLLPDSEIVMPHPRRSLTIREVQGKYAPLWNRWVEKFGYRYAINAIQGELGHLGWFGDRLCKKYGYRVVVMGHTHDAEMDKDWFMTRDRVYANAGHWCCRAPTYVEVNKQKDKYVVSLKKVTKTRDGKYRFDQTVKSKDVPIK